MNNIHPEFKTVMTNSFVRAKHFGYREVLPEHILIAMLDDETNQAIELFKELGFDLESVATYFYNLCNINKQFNITEVDVMPSTKVKNIVFHMHELRDMYGHKEATLIHLFTSILKNNNEVRKYFNKLNIYYSTMKDKLNSDAIRASIDDFNGDPDNGGGYKKERRERRGKNKTAVLDNFCRNITEMAEDGNLDPVVGRDKEIEDICRILARRKKNNPIILGEPGTGKSAIAEGLAIKIKEGKVPTILSGKKIVSLDLS